MKTKTNVIYIKPDNCSPKRRNKSCCRKKKCKTIKCCASPTCVVKCRTPPTCGCVKKIKCCKSNRGKCVVKVKPAKCCPCECDSCESCSENPCDSDSGEDMSDGCDSPCCEPAGKETCKKYHCTLKCREKNNKKTYELTYDKEPADSCDEESCDSC